MDRVSSQREHISVPQDIDIDGWNRGQHNSQDVTTPDFSIPRKDLPLKQHFGQSSTTVAKENAPNPLHARSPRGAMEGHYTEITVALLAMCSPLILSGVLLSLVYGYVKLDNGYSSYSSGGSGQLPLGNAYYVDYSATRLVFVSSLSSTISLALIPVAMLLFSYPLAFDLKKRSNASEISLLPSPYQLELLIRLLRGNTMDLWHYVQYVLRGRKKRIAVVPVLSNAALMLMFTLGLAVLIILADTWLHISTSSVEYTQVQVQAKGTDSRFSPGRGLPATCLNSSSIGTQTSFAGCIFDGGGSGSSLSLFGSTEAYLTLGNKSTNNQLYFSNGAAVLGPMSPPADTDFTAESYASSTSCEMVTMPCGAHFIDPDGSDASRDVTYDCTSTAGGLTLSGNFSDLRSQQVSSSSSSNVNYALAFTYYNTSDKTVDVASWIGKNANRGRSWWGLVFALPPLMVQYDSDQSSYSTKLDVINLPDSSSGGIMSCTTNLSDVIYNFVDGRIANFTSQIPMNSTASAPFTQAIAYNFGQESLGAGLVLAAASASSPADFATRFAQVYDQTTLGLLAGTLPHRAPLSTSVRSTSLVARVPRAPFIALIVLNLALAVVGIALAAWALVLCRLGVRDVQARLSTGALVAELFESPEFNAKARCVDDLYAERQGLRTARVAISDEPGGLGTRYRRVDVPVQGEYDGNMNNKGEMFYCSDGSRNDVCMPKRRGCRLK